MAAVSEAAAILRLLRNKVAAMHQEAERNACRQQGVEAAMEAMLAHLRADRTTGTRDRRSEGYQRQAKAMSAAAASQASRFAGAAQAAAAALAMIDALAAAERGA